MVFASFYSSSYFHFHCTLQLALLSFPLNFYCFTISTSGIGVFLKAFLLHKNFMPASNFHWLSVDNTFGFSSTICWHRNNLFASIICCQSTKLFSSHQLFHPIIVLHIRLAGHRILDHWFTQPESNTVVHWFMSISTNSHSVFAKYAFLRHNPHELQYSGSL